MRAGEGVVNRQNIILIRGALGFFVDDALTLTDDFCKLFFVGDGNNGLNGGIACAFLKFRIKLSMEPFDCTSNT